jgi:hypothetical protein
MQVGIRAGNRIWDETAAFRVRLANRSQSATGPIPDLERGMFGANAGRDASLEAKRFRILI